MRDDPVILLEEAAQAAGQGSRDVLNEGALANDRQLPHP